PRLSLFPYTTLFRSRWLVDRRPPHRRAPRHDAAAARPARAAGRVHRYARPVPLVAPRRDRPRPGPGGQGGLPQRGVVPPAGDHLPRRLGGRAGPAVAVVDE